MADKKYKLSFGMSDGSTKEAAFSVPVFAVRPQDYGAKGDGSTDDTAAFQSALAANRVVFVPGGTYKLSGELVIGNNSCLELSQDTVLNFTQTSGNCISMKMSASIEGNHATVNVPYTFSGNVVYVSTALNDNVLAIPPWAKWTPQWKTGRYITNLNITKPNSDGFHYSNDGTCYGTAVYISADNAGTSEYRSKFIWGLNFYGLRIAGGFNYGVRAQNFNDAWNHEMKIEAFIDACKIGVSLEDCNNAYISAVIQPRKAANETPYAVHGIKLSNCKNTELSGSRVWDWDANHSLWAEGNMYQHLALIGDCSGAILNEYYYYDNPTHDIRSLIYTDTPSNLERLTILQEPITRWFKPIDLEPYFDNGETVRRLALKEQLDEIVPIDKLPNFTNVLPTAIDKTGAVFEGVGYVRYGMRWGNGNNTLYTDQPYYGCTGLIPIKSGDRVYVDGIKLIYGTDTTPNVVLFKSDFSYAHHVTAGTIKNATWYFGYEETEEGFIVDLKSPLFTEKAAAYVAFSFSRNAIGAKPMISINNPISYTISGTLADGIKVKVENIVGLGSGEGSGEDESIPGLSPGGSGGTGLSDEQALALLIELDMLPAATNSSGAMLTDRSGNIILRY